MKNKFCAFQATFIYIVEVNMSILATGIIYFEKILSDSLFDELSFYIQKKSNENKIGINLAYNLSAHAMSRYENNGKFVFDQSKMIFQITDSPWYSQCEDLFTPVSYNEKNECLGIDLSVSRLPSIQKFFTNVLDHEMVRGILFSLEAGDSTREEFERYDIKVNEFCSTVNHAYKKTKPTSYLTPSIKINISN